jgi:hypothetical protein
MAVALVALADAEAPSADAFEPLADAPVLRAIPLEPAQFAPKPIAMEYNCDAVLESPRATVLVEDAVEFPIATDPRPVARPP